MTDDPAVGNLIGLGNGARGQHPGRSSTALTRREREILLWIANGKSYWETARILSISEGTVRIHLASIRKKLDAPNTTNAVAKALYQRVIVFIPRQ